ncbi:MAG: ATP-binding protein [Thermodesulfobacteriota bacterium]
MCQPLPLQQAFTHLLTNAYQAIEEQGVITVTTRPENNGVSLSIADNGTGIPAKDIERIFEPFFTTQEVGAGMGLGLSLAYDTISSKDHGTIKVQSNPGQKTIFTLHIPSQT